MSSVIWEVLDCEAGLERAVRATWKKWREMYIVGHMIYCIKTTSATIP